MCALLSAVFVFAITAVSLPGTAFASEMKLAACSVNLRTYPSTTARIKTTLKTGMRVTAVAAVRGSAWRATCNGKTISSRYWYRISGINGKSVRSLYGVTYVYGALYLFKAPTPAPTTLAPATSVVEFTGDATGATDVSAAITSFLNNNKGKTVGFKAGGTYHVDSRIQISGWTGTILGRDATFRRYATDAGRDSILRLIGGSSVRIDNLNIRGPATLSNVTNWTSWSREDEHALFIDSGTNITVVGGSFTNTWGDGIYIRERENSSYGVPNGIVLDGVVLDVNVRNGVSVTNGRNITLKNCKSSNSGLTGFDAEPNRTTDVIDNISIRGCEFRTFNAGHTPSASGNGYAIYASAGATYSSDVVIDGNWFDRGAIYAIAPSGTRNQRITITNNSAGSAGVASIGRTDGLIFSGNSNITKNVVYP